MAIVYVGLGSNLRQPAEQIRRAVNELRQHNQIQLQAVSPLYRSTAVGPGDQPDYINAVAHIKTSLSPHALLAQLQQLEAQQGRVRNQRWGARTLDLDILLYDDLQISEPDLTIPHPQIASRIFVLAPLHDLDPDLVLPGGTPLDSLLANCPRQGIVKFADN